MKKLYFLIPVLLLVLASCTKRAYYPDDPHNESDWVRTHDHGVVAFVDYSTGNYVVDTYGGFTVVEQFGGIGVEEYDDVYAYFSNPGVQSIYNLSVGHFSQARIVDSWLSWSDAMYIIDDLKYGGY